MTSTTTLAHNERQMSAAETQAQIGRYTALATSGGQIRHMRNKVGELTALELPVSSGYAVRVTLAANDTYTVQRIMRRGLKTWVKGTATDVYAEDLGGTVYLAGCYKNVTFPRSAD